MEKTRTLGEALQARRKAGGLTIQALSAKAGVHRTTVSRWERGEATPFAHELTRVLDALGVSRKEREVYYRNVEAPRAIQLMDAGADALLPISSGELLRALRQRAGVSQREVARVARVAQSLVVKWEKSECWPNQENLHAFCFAVGASEEELIFLAARSWNDLASLPQDKEALDDFFQNPVDDSNPVWACAYLALAARYQSLHRSGKIDAVEALSAYGVYAEYLAWRLQRFEDARRVAAPLIASLGRSRGALNQGQFAALHCQVAYDDAFGNERRNVPRNYGTRKRWEDNLALLEAFEPRCPPRRRLTYRRLSAQNWEKIGNPRRADALYQYNLASASSERENNGQSWAYVEFLCRQRRFQDAIPVLTPPSTLCPEAPPLVHVKNWCNHAEVLAGLGDYSQADAHLSQAVAYARQHGDPSLSEHEFLRIGSQIERGRHEKKRTGLLRMP